MIDLQDKHPRLTLRLLQSSPPQSPPTCAGARGRPDRNPPGCGRAHCA